MEAARGKEAGQANMGEPERRDAERSEAARSGGSPIFERETPATPSGRPPDPEVTARHAHLVNWRRGREEGLTPKKRGRKAATVDPRVKKLEQENRRLERRLQKAEAIIAFQKKVHELLGIPLKPFESDEDD